MKNGFIQRVEELNGRDIVLIKREKKRTQFSEADFNKSGMALQGILHKKENLNQFNKRINKKPLNNF